MLPWRQRPLDFQRWGGLATSLIIIGIGWALLRPYSHLGQRLILSSYDWTFRLPSIFPHELKDSEVVIVYLDDKSHQELKEPYDRPWNRRRHAALLDQLKAYGSKAVVFDIVFAGPGPDPAADQAFEEAIRRNGRVVLAADYTPHREAVRIIENTVTRPLEAFEDACAGYGLAALSPNEDLDFIVRKHWHGTIDEPGLCWATAQVLKLPVAVDPLGRQAERWIRYYGGPETIPSMSYVSALDPTSVPPNFFRDKVVFVGSRPMTGYSGERRDELRTPFTSSGATIFPFIPNVDVHATQMLNLIRRDWLRRPPPIAEAGLLLVTGLLFGLGLFRCTPFAATGAAGVTAAGVLGIAAVLFTFQGIWLPWFLMVGVQLPGAWIGCIAFKSAEWYIQRRKLEEERRRNDLRIRQQAELLNKAQDAILVSDLGWRVTFWNKSAEQLYGWTAAEVMGRPLIQHLRCVDEAPFQQGVTQVLQTGTWIGELRHKTKSGQELTVQSRWSLVCDDAGKPQSILAINTDLTERKKLEAQFLRAQRMESIGTLAGGIAHDLNNVLSPIVMGTELLQEMVKDEGCIKLLKTMSSSAQRGADMVKQVLTFARGTAGEKMVLQMGHLIKEMEKIAKETFPKEIEVRSNLEKNLPLILADATQMHQVLLNLCVNARDAMPDGGKIMLEARAVQFTEAECRRILGAKPIRYLALQVKDTGTGIPQDILDKIFEPFFTTKEQGKGTGLGLSTVMSIIKANEGLIEVNSTVGAGTTFNIFLPAAEAAQLADFAKKPREQMSGNRELILLVDDELPILEVAACALTGSGYRTLTATSGAQAIEVYRANASQVDLAVVDMMMPKMNGAATVRALRELQPGLRTVITTGLYEAEKTQAQFGSEPVTILSKPFSIEQLLLSVQEALAKATAMGNPVPPQPIPTSRSPVIGNPIDEGKFRQPTGCFPLISSGTQSLLQPTGGLPQPGGPAALPAPR